MSGFIMAAQMLTSLCLLVFVHELGHFLAARAFGIRVDKFFIFFDWGGKLWSKKIGDTEYGIGIIPLGGYVKISGMIDESMDTEQMKKPPQSWEFRSKPAWQRLIVMLAGVVMNVIVGVLIFTFAHMHYNKEYVDISKVEEGIYAYEYAETLGFQTGDIITAIDGKDVVRYADVFSTRMFFGDEVTVLRNGNVVNITLPDTLYHYIVKGEGYFLRYDNYPFKMDSVLSGGNAEKAGLQSYDDILTVDGQDVAALGGFRESLFAKRGDSVDLKISRLGDIMDLSVPVDSSGMIGIALDSYDFPVQPYTFALSMKYGSKDAFESVRANAKGLGKVFSGKEKVKDSLQGPIGIAKIFGGTWNWRRFWSITGLLSMVLAFMNILPIPALDGGHVLFTLVEMVIGHKLPDRYMEIFQMIGLVIVMGLMIFIIGNDIINLF